MTHRARLAAGIVAFGVFCSLPASAQSVRLIGDFRDWSAYATSEGAGALCFALSKPRDINPIPDGYTEAYLYLTNRPAESIRNEFNLVAGYAFAPDSPATVTISGQSFDLFTEKDAAWLLDPAQSDSLASAIRAGSSLVIEGTSDKGIRIAQTFSLSGATAASRALESDC
ncbi:MAG: invasion associated locus B family protein [Devosia sp.]